MLSRRSVLLGALSLPYAASTVPLAVSQPAEFPRLVVLATGVDRNTSVSRLNAVVMPLMNAGIPLGLMVDPIGTQGRPLQSDDALAQQIRAHWDKNAALLEVGLDIPEFDDNDPYFSLRRTSVRQAKLTKALNPAADPYVERLLMAATVTTFAKAQNVEDFASLRAVGVRSVYHLPASSSASPPGIIRRTATGLVGLVTPSQPVLPAPAEIADLIAGPNTDGNPVVLTIPFPVLARMGPDEVSSYTTALAKVVGNGLSNGRLKGVLPYDAYLSLRRGPARYVIVRVDDFRLSADFDRSHRQLVDQLLDLGVPLTQGIIPGGAQALGHDTPAAEYIRGLLKKSGYDFATHGMDHTPNELFGNVVADDLHMLTCGIGAIERITRATPLTYIPPYNAFDDNARRALSLSGDALLSADHGNYDWIWGLDEYGILHASKTIGLEKSWTIPIDHFSKTEALELIGPRNDAVLMVHPQTLETERLRMELLDVLDALKHEAGTELTNFRNYYAQTLPQIPLLSRIQQARQQVYIVDVANSQVEIADDNLKADAATAWQYFDVWRDKYDGLCPSTSWRDGGAVDGYPFATMWDIASVIMANISAYRLGFIDHPYFERSAAQIIQHLSKAVYRYNGLHLPMEEYALSRQPGARTGFDSADVGRLLIALKILDRETNNTLGITSLVDRWDLSATIRNGKMHDLHGRRAISVHENSYAQYAARGYQLWGHVIDPIFSEAHPLKDMDSTQRFLRELQSRGPIATEPSTTEHIEVGASESGTLIMDLLLDAQIRRYRKTGILTCVSEGPADSPPWFTYQAYQVEGDGGSWVVDVPQGTKKMSARQIQKFRAVSTKGCFLWLATRPGEYSSELHAVARSKARISGLGFACGLSETSLRATQHSDVNTNGIILEAITYILNGRKALLST